MAKKKQTPRQWVHKVLRSTGIDAETFYHRLGAWSNKPKQEVMERNGLSEQQYSKRYQFLGDAFCVLEEILSTGNSTSRRRNK